MLNNNKTQLVEFVIGVSSDLYSLFDFKDFRDTLDMEKAYLQGRFDAIPYIYIDFNALKIYR